MKDKNADKGSSVYPKKYPKYAGLIFSVCTILPALLFHEMKLSVSTATFFTVALLLDALFGAKKRPSTRKRRIVKTVCTLALLALVGLFAYTYISAPAASVYVLAVIAAAMALYPFV